MRSVDLALDHDVAGSARTDRDTEAVSIATRASSNFIALDVPLPAYERAATRSDWKAALDDVKKAFLMPVVHTAGGLAPVVKVWLRPKLALAQAKVGDIAAARASIANTPEDCFL